MARQIDIFRALADPTRLRIVALLREMELSVGELAQVLAQSQPRVSRHVKILCDAGLARRRKEGSWVFLCPGRGETMTPLFQMIDQWEAIDSKDHWVVADAARLAAVRADRAAAAQTWFADHAGQWDAIRSLHVAESDVEAAIRAILADRPLGRLVDIGTGTGRILELLAPEAVSALGIDRSPEMLRLARAKLSAPGAVGFELQQGDISRLLLDDGIADTVTMHQVLHYLPAPELAIAEAARIVAPGGHLLIVDFAPHDKEELRTRDAHQRLGFSDEQISNWFSSAGVSLNTVQELGGGELTVKLWLGSKPVESKLKVVRS